MKSVRGAAQQGITELQCPSLEAGEPSSVRLPRQPSGMVAQSLSLLIAPLPFEGPLC